jgi:hypothetical protein
MIAINGQPTAWIALLNEIADGAALHVIQKGRIPRRQPI